MTTFLRLLEDKDKQSALLGAVRSFGENVFEVDPSSFSRVPGAPFSYWVSDQIRQIFGEFPAFESRDRTVKQGMATADDFRFVRAWWEVNRIGSKWLAFAKGGSFSRFYADLFVVVNWDNDGAEIRNFFDPKTGKLSSRPQNISFFGKAGLTWPLRGIVFSSQAVPTGCAFSIAGKMAFAPESELEAWLAIFNSRAFGYLIKLFAGKVGGVQYEAGLIGGIPAPDLTKEQIDKLAFLAKRGWCIKRKIASTEEISRAFLLPGFLRSRADDFDRSAIDVELAELESDIDHIVFPLYGFSDSDRAAALGGEMRPETSGQPECFDAFEVGEEADPEINEMVGLLSWAAGVAFGRFDWRLATGAREVPPDPDPFDPLPEKSPGMLQNGDEPFHHHVGILVNDEGHQHDLASLIEQVLETVDAPVSQDIRRWLRKDFFSSHLQQYSKSRRKAPIYWPLSTASGDYTVWIYYPQLTSQTLFTVVNDFVEPKLDSVRDSLSSLRAERDGVGSKQAKKERENLEDLEHELVDLRDLLLDIVPSYRPSHDDGAQIAAAPLWPLFQHKPWKNVLKDTWKQLEKGDLDWAQIALNYWPYRVLRKCHQDRSLSIAHDVEDQFWEEVEVPEGRRGKNTGETKLEWQPKDLSESEIDVLIKRIIEERGL